MNYDDAVNLLKSQGKFYINLGLDRVRSVLSILGNPQDNLRCIHVAGTNGKGSVCAIISSILKYSGMKVGLYTSPHIFEYTERIKINDEFISKNDFAKHVQLICKIADENEIHLTEFEILTVLMFKYFNDNNVDVVVLETGLGGRLDATNVIKKNLCAIITHIDFDHTERLGNTLEQIAFEKSGIIKNNSLTIVSESYEIFLQKSGEKISKLILAKETDGYEKYLNLKGLHQKSNLALALSCIKNLFPNVKSDVIIEGLKNVKHQFRFEYRANKNLIIDAAHNPNGISALRKNLDCYYPNLQRRFIFGCLKNKDYESMIKILFKSDDEIYFYKFNYPNSADISDLQNVCPYNSFEFDYKNFDINNNTKLTVICGSFYMLKEIMDKLVINNV